MHIIHISEDQGLAPKTVVRIRCDCGWEDKAFAGRHAEIRALGHLRTKHNQIELHTKTHY